MDTGHRPSVEEKQEYEFIQEVIKNEKKKSTFQLLRWASVGLIFGISACLGFFALKPIIEKVNRANPSQVEIPRDDMTQKKKSQSDKEQDTAMSVDDYREMNEKLLAIAQEAEKSVVEVVGIKKDGSWEDSNSQGSGNLAGLIVADNGPELLILAGYSNLKSAELFRVTFQDGTQHEAAMKQKDGNSNLAIFSVAKSEIKESTWNEIKVATLGNSNALSKGSILIAIGTPFGYEKGIGYGAASSVDETVLIADGEYRILITDMPKTEKSSGFLFDSYGKVMGMIIPGLMEKKGTETLAAMGISSIKNEIEFMSNGKSVPYMGIIGTIVTREMSEIQGIPTGLYVREVEADSPAMKAGIQSGDIIVKVEKKDILSIEEFYSVLIEKEPGKIVKCIGNRYDGENYVNIQFHVTIGVKQ